MGPTFLSIIVNDVKSADNSRTLLVDYADDIILSTQRSKNYDCYYLEVNAIKKWPVDEQVTLNLSKTKELIVRGRSEASLPQPLRVIEQVDHMKLLGVSFHHSPNDWDLHFDTLLGKAGRWEYVLRVCKRYGHIGDMPHYLFRSLTIMFLLTRAVSVWGRASYSTYLCRTDKLQDRAVRFEYLKYTTPIKDLIKQSDAIPWADIYSNNEYPLDCLSPLRGMEFWRKGGTLTSYPKLRLRVFKPYF